MREVVLAATQMTSDWDREKNVANAIDLFREFTDRGTPIVQIQEFFEAPTSAPTRKKSYSAWSQCWGLSPLPAPLDRISMIGHRQNAACFSRHGAVLPLFKSNLTECLLSGIAKKAASFSYDRIDARRGDPDVRWRAKSIAAVRRSARVVDRLQHLARDSFVLTLERSRLSILHGE